MLMCSSNAGRQLQAALQHRLSNFEAASACDTLAVLPDSLSAGLIGPNMLRMRSRSSWSFCFIVAKQEAGD